MKKLISILGGVVLAATLGSPAFAHPGKGGGGGGGGGESQKGGLPALEDRVDALQALIAALQAQVVTLQNQIADLQGQNNWAVVEATGAIDRHSGTPGSVTVNHTASTGVYEVVFSKDVSGCAYEATIGDATNVVPAQGQISVSGDTDSDSPNDVYVQTFDKTGLTPTDSPFHLYVSCP
ncbi:MAG: hypothetical protein ACYDBH_24645 [Acidobacteriaceae bacterium]